MPVRNELTSNSELLKKPQYHKVKEIVKKLHEGKMLDNFAGNCISAADVVQHLISHAGIPCKIIECQACLIRNDGATQDYLFIGYNNKNYTGQIDTHVVVITTDDCPMLIDLSLAHVLPKDRPFIVEMLQPTTSVDVIAEFEIANITLTYSVKKDIRLPAVHQKNLMERIINEQEQAQLLQKQSREVNLIRWIVTASVCMALINFVALCVILFLKIVYHT